MVDALLDADPKDQSSVHVLFAGGIHDARSAAIVAGIAAPLAARGIRCGVLMGTAYLFTTEAVSSGAITARYQREAMDCADTVLLVSGVGHANRVARTEFTAEYFAARRALLDAGQPADEIRDELEKLTLGRLRLATKGVMRRTADAPLVEASDAEQVSGGIYMLGQVATLRGDAITMRALHHDVCAGATQLVQAAATPASRHGAEDEARRWPSSGSPRSCRARSCPMHCGAICSTRRARSQKFRRIAGMRACCTTPTDTPAIA
jgi:NAD(P)H-dependent flavin oxidoreductase YrpB (nitropropane dioxygenase family)